MFSPWAPSQLPKGTSFLTHSALRASHRMLVGCSIQAEYETIAHDSTTRKGAAITMRRRRRLRLTAGPPGCSPRAAPWMRDAGTGGDSAASGGAFTPEPLPDRRRPLISSRSSLDRARHGQKSNTQVAGERHARPGPPLSPGPFEARRMVSMCAVDTGGAGVDMVFDGVGGEIGRAAFEVTARGGQISAHGTPGGGFASVA